MDELDLRDKHRIVITGNQAAVIASMVAWVYRSYERKFDLIRGDQIVENQNIKTADAPVVIISDNRRSYADLLKYHHHMAVISDVDEGVPNEASMMAFADATPKAGIILYSDRGLAAAIGNKARPDVTSIPYGTFSTKQEDGKVYLLTSTSEAFPVALRSEQDLRSLSAAKEILKKTGISSGQFYSAITTFNIG